MLTFSFLAESDVLLLPMPEPMRFRADGGVVEPGMGEMEESVRDERFSLVERRDRGERRRRKDVGDDG